MTVNTKPSTTLTEQEAGDIAEILKRRANEVAAWADRVAKEGGPGSVEMAFTREIRRLRELADRLSDGTD